MTDEKLNDLLQKWAASRIRFSREHGQRSWKLAKIMASAPKVECESRPSSVECVPRELQKKRPRSASAEAENLTRLGNMKA